MTSRLKGLGVEQKMLWRRPLILKIRITMTVFGLFSIGMNFLQRISTKPLRWDKKNSIEVAWSNEAFELWYLYHFQNVITGVSRKNYEEKISTAVNASPKYKSKKKYRYAKKDPNNYKIMTTYGSMESALRYAEAKHLEYADSRYANQNPCTTIYQLVRQLLGRDEKLNAELIARIGENEL